MHQPNDTYTLTALSKNEETALLYLTNNRNGLLDVIEIPNYPILDALVGHRVKRTLYGIIPCQFY